MSVVRSVVAGLGLAGCVRAAPLPLDAVRLPPGFEISVFAEGLPSARQMALGDRGTVFVGSLRAGAVYAAVDRDGDGRAENVFRIASGLRSPSGVAFRSGDLYVAEIGRVLRFPGVEERLSDPPPPVVVTEALPREAHHGWKFIAFGPDTRLYIPVGAPCNVCEPGDPFAAILRMNPDGSELEVFARGVRNSVGFDWNPQDGSLWFTDNGRDWLGEDIPPDELNRAPRSGLHFGFPRCHGRGIVDPEYGRGGGCEGTVAPALELGPHVAAIGMRFYTGRLFPEEYRGRIFIAEHGSWNRRVPIGYRVTTVAVHGEEAGDYRVFAEGWLRNGTAWGRPADVLVAPDGALLVSDDLAGVVYRIVWRPSERH